MNAAADKSALAQSGVPGIDNGAFSSSIVPDSSALMPVGVWKDPKEE